MYDKKLDLFLQVARLGSFSKASKESFITTAAVFKQMNQLEQECGVKLFIRSKRGVRLTRAGNSLREDAEDIIKRSGQALLRAQHIEANQNHQPIVYDEIRLGSSLMYPYKPLMQRINRHPDEFRRFKISLVSIDDKSQSFLDLLPHLGDGIDIIPGLCDFYAWQSFCSICPLGELPFTVSIPRNHRLASRTIIKIDDLLGERLYTLRPGSSKSVDRLREHLARNYMGIKLVGDKDVYDLDTFNRANEEEMIVLSYPVWEDVHPNFVNVPVAWRHSATYGLMCEYEMPPKVLRFLNALVDTFRGENVERERRML